MKYINCRHRLYIRRKNRIANIVNDSKIKKYVIYIRRSNKHFYVAINDKSEVLAYVCTLKMRKTQDYKNKLLRELIPYVFNEFRDKVIKKIGYISQSNIVYNIKHYTCKGNVSTFVKLFNTFAQENCNVNTQNKNVYNNKVI